ncbi:sigma-70 family RNA polymerase sigma factor [Pseudoruegeria sp. HB172150]|uniref:sigma-70 family RNA polymerase sigma factor n=1 Tax=Pseudoruegeria sp. HB172150 TaxID=2721164 RepID=UPI00155729B4|nr:sigma-70 family RNA polymerase sigma factor [Pseudoruegeria sp. HB172150]
MSSPDEIEELIARVKLRDREAFARLYSVTSAKLFGICLRVLKNRAEAEEALQDVYVRIWRKADAYTAGGYSPMTWLITMARNIAIDKLRSRKTASADIDDLPEIAAPGPTPEGEALAASERRQIEACLAELETDRAGAVRSAYLDGESYKELALRYKVPLNTMRTWLRRSLLSLRECLTR